MTAPTTGRTTRARVYLRCAVVCAVAATTLACLSTSEPDSAHAAPAGTGSATAQAAQVTQGGGINATQKLGVATSLPGVLGLTVSQLTSQITNTVSQPLANALTALPGSIANQLASGLTGSGLQASSPDGPQNRPSSGFPTCGSQGWDSGDCYGPTVQTISAPPAVVINTGTMQGYATGDTTGYIAAAESGHPQLTVLGLALGDLGVIDSSAQCGPTTTSSCGATQTVTGSSLLGGHLTLALANGGSLLAQVDNKSIPAGGTTINALGTNTLVTVNGNLVTLKIAVPLNQLLSGLGLSALLGSLGSIGTLADAGSTATLTVTIGPGNISQSSPASAWGLDVGIDLSADVKLSLTTTVITPVSLASIEVVTSGTSPDITDLKLAYSTATAGSPPPPYAPVAII